MFLRNSTSQVIKFGPFLDSTDGVTAETALTITQADMQLSKDGAAFAQKAAAGNATHDTDGWYSTTLDATDTATNGELIIQVNVAGALPVWVKYYVVPASTYDALTTNGLNNVAATDIVSAGAITTSSGAVSTVTSVTNDVGVTQAAADKAWNTATRTITSLPSAPANWLTASAIATSALNGKGNWNIGKTGYSLTQSFPTNFADMAITATTGQVTVGTNNDKTGYSISGTKTTLDALNDIAATSIVSGGAINTTAGAIDNVTLVATTTANTDMRGTDSALLASSAPANFSDMSISATTGLVDITQAAADKAWSTASRVLTAGTNLNDISVNDILTTQMTESYAADGVAPTLAQAIFVTMQNLQDFSFSGTTQTVKKLDGTTTAATYTLDDATAPTSKTRTT